jgi:hypothetical protein
MKGFLYLVLLMITTGYALGSSSGELKLDQGKDKYSLYKFQDNKDDQGYFGVYRLFVAYTGGKLIYLFPDFQYAITEFCDICPEETLEMGTFNLRDSRLVFSPNEEAEQKKSYELSAYYGRIEKEKYTMGFLPILLDEKQLSEIKGDPVSYDYWTQIEPYTDWKNKIDILSKNISNKAQQ